jgi:cytochrome c-type biogenesis protein CcmE
VKAKNQRLMLAALAIVAVIAAGLLALSGLKDQAAFFYAPSDVKKDGLPLGKAVRLGGMVVDKSIKRAADGVTMHFVVTDGLATTPVTFSGIAPDLFREKSGVVAEGQFQPNGSFVATNLLAKHDEKYMPPELAGKMHETKSLKP